MQPRESTRLACVAGKVASVNTSRGGVPKTSVSEARVSTYGLDGDHQREQRIHGGPDRAVALYSLERIEALQREGHPIAAGTTGENLTLSGIEWESMTPGRELTVGAVRLLITAYASP